jgi:lipopolysaccharide export system protein LptA
MKRMSLAAVLWVAGAVAAAAGGGASAPGGGESGLLPGGNSKDPVSIEADGLVYSDKEGKATYSGNVVLTQGLTKLMCTVMVLYIDKGNGSPSATPGQTAKPTPSPSASGAPSSSSNQVRHMDCTGPVTVISKTQTATGDSAVYDKPQNKVWLIGNITLADGPNVTKGDKLTYDLVTGIAHVETKVVQGKPGRVWSQFVPGTEGNATPTPSASPSPNQTSAAAVKPAPAKSSAPKP